MAANLMCSNDGGGGDGDDECHIAVEWGLRHVETLQGCCCLLCKQVFIIMAGL